MIITIQILVSIIFILSIIAILIDNYIMIGQSYPNPSKIYGLFEHSFFNDQNKDKSCYKNNNNILISYNYCQVLRVFAITNIGILFISSLLFPKFKFLIIILLYLALILQTIILFNFLSIFINTYNSESIEFMESYIIQGVAYLIQIIVLILVGVYGKDMICSNK